jgi:hypothetical protein
MQAAAHRDFQGLAGMHAFENDSIWLHLIASTAGECSLLCPATAQSRMCKTPKVWAVSTRWHLRLSLVLALLFFTSARARASTSQRTGSAVCTNTSWSGHARSTGGSHKQETALQAYTPPATQHPQHAAGTLGHYQQALQQETSPSCQPSNAASPPLMYTSAFLLTNTSRHRLGVPPSRVPCNPPSALPKANMGPPSHTYMHPFSGCNATCFLRSPAQPWRAVGRHASRGIYNSLPPLNPRLPFPQNTHE